MSRKHYDWPRVIDAAAAVPGVWRLRFPNEKVRLAKRIRLRQHPALRRDDGVLEVRVMHEYERDGIRRGDIWVRWIPTTRNTHTEE